MFLFWPIWIGQDWNKYLRDSYRNADLKEKHNIFFKHLHKPRLVIFRYFLNLIVRYVLPESLAYFSKN